MSRRILLYSHDTMGLGHIRRITAIARRLAAGHPQASLLVLTGSSVAEAYPLPPNVDVLKLPSLRKLSNSSYAARRLRMSRDRIVGLRAALILETAVSFDPDLLVVDKAPLGVHDELRPTLERLRARKPACRVVLSLRDILDEPEEVARNWRREGVVEALRAYYDRILVWGMPEVYDLVREYDLPADIAGRVEYCGYIAAGSDARDSRRTPGKRMVLATVGGGEDGATLLSTFLRSLPLTAERFGAVVVMGPDLPEDRRAEIRELVRKCPRPVFAFDFTRQMERLLASADVVVSMGGYNTVCEVLSRGLRNIIVPRTRPRREQLLRAERLQDLGAARMIHPDALDPATLAAAIDDELRSPARNGHGGLDFRGLDRAMSVLGADLADGQGPAREAFA